MMLRKCLMASAMVIAPTIVLTEVPPSTINPDLNPCALFTPDADYVDFFVDMRLENTLVSMSVPKVFLEDKFDHEDGAKHSAQLFTVMVDTFEPVTRRQTGVLNRNGIKNWMTILVEDTLDRERIATFALDRAFPDVPRIPFASYALTDAAFDLVQAVPQGNEPQDDVFFVIGSNGVPSTIIACTTPSTVAFPLCNHSFRAAGMDIYIDYRRSELGNWRAIQNNVTQFLGCSTYP